MHATWDQVTIPSVAPDHPITSYKSFLKPLQFCRLPCVKGGLVTFSIYRGRGTKQLSEESGTELGFEHLKPQPIQESRGLSSESPGSPHRMQAANGEKRHETEVEGLHSLQTA